MCVCVCVCNQCVRRYTDEDWMTMGHLVVGVVTFVRSRMGLLLNVMA